MRESICSGNGIAKFKSLMLPISPHDAIHKIYGFERTVLFVRNWWNWKPDFSNVEWLEREKHELWVRSIKIFHQTIPSRQFEYTVGKWQPHVTLEHYSFKKLLMKDIIGSIVRLFSSLCSPQIWNELSTQLFMIPRKYTSLCVNLCCSVETSEGGRRLDSDTIDRHGDTHAYSVTCELFKNGFLS